jgi:hypothetical protein
VPLSSKRVLARSLYLLLHTINRAAGLFPLVQRLALERKSCRPVFIHIPKTAGKSVLSSLGYERALHYSASVHLMMWNMIFPGSNLAPNLFSIVRDPESRFYSAISYVQSGGNGSILDALRAYLLNAYLPLNEISLQRLLKDRVLMQAPVFMPQSFFLKKKLKYRIRIYEFSQCKELLEREPWWPDNKPLGRLNVSSSNCVKLSLSEVEDFIDRYKRDYRLHSLFAERGCAVLDL